MKILLSVTFFWLLSLLSAFSQSSDIHVEHAKKLLERIIEIKSQRPGWDNPPTVIESGARNLKKTPEFVQLEEKAATGWPVMMANLELVAPSDVAKTILFVAFQSLSEDEYLKFLQQAVGKTEVGVVDKRILKWALMPMAKNIRGVVSLNYEKPITQDIIRRVKILYANDGNMPAYYNDVLSGKTKKEMETYLRDNFQKARSDPARRHIFHDLPESPQAQLKAKTTLFPLWVVCALAGVGLLAVGAYFFAKRKK